MRFACLISDKKTNMFDFKRKSVSIYDLSEADAKKIFIDACVRDKFKTWFEKDGVDIVATRPNDMRVFLLSETSLIHPEKIDPLSPYQDLIHYCRRFGLGNYQWFVRAVPADKWFARGLGSMSGKLNLPIGLICQTQGLLSV